MQLYKEKHDFIRIFLHKSRVVVGRGGFEALPTSTALYFKGIHDYAPTMPQVNFFFYFIHFFQFSKSKTLTLSRTGLDAYQRTAESLYFQGFPNPVPLLSQGIIH